MTEIDTVVGTGFKVVCGRDELAARLGVVARGVSTRSAVQILAGILLQAQPGRVELAATDMELSLRTGLEADVHGEGRVVVPGRLLVELVRLLPTSEVEIEQLTGEHVLRIRSGGAESRLNTYGAEDFPRLPDVDAVSTYSV